MKQRTSLLMTVLVMIAQALSGPARADEGVIQIDGSSTVYPITEAVAEEYRTEAPDIKVTVGISGTGGGFKKFCGGEIAVADASRPIKAAEREACQKNRVDFVELPVAIDALSVVVNPANDWARTMTTAELKRLWEPEAQGKIMTWSDVRDGWPKERIALFGPGVDSGTYDYFTEVIVGREGASRGDFTSSEDDNVLVQGIAGNKHSLGFFGMAYYQENSGKLQAVAIDDGKTDNGQGPQLPTYANVVNGNYQPLASPLFIYVRKQALDQHPETKAFVEFYLTAAPELLDEVGYVRLPPGVQKLAAERLAKGVLGTVFEQGAAGKTLLELMARE